jgi:hypothetical protein
MNLTIGTRWVLDQAYYLLVILVLLNIIFGIIIDTFGSLRLDKLQRAEDTLNVCFICGIEKQIFDRASDEPDGFKTHIKLDHNMWNYLYFIFLLWEQDKDDDDGLEQYVRRAIAANEITWFPLHKAIRLDQAASEEESLLNDLKRKIKASESSVARKLDKFQTEINVVLENLTQTLKHDQLERSDTASRKSLFYMKNSKNNSLNELNAANLNENNLQVNSSTVEKKVEVVRKNRLADKFLFIEVHELYGIDVKSFENEIFVNCLVSFESMQNSLKSILITDQKVLFLNEYLDADGNEVDHNSGNISFFSLF